MKPNPSRRSWLPAAVATVAVLSAVGLTGAPAQAAGPLPSRTTLTSSTSTAHPGDPVTLTAKVSVLGLGLLVVPSGPVTFTAVNGTTHQNLGSVTLSGCLIAPCTAALTTSALSLGTNAITASYGGDLLTGASSASVSVGVVANAPAAPTLTATPLVGSIQLAWSSASDGGSPITGYRLYRSGSANGTYTLIADNLPTGDFQDTTTVVGTTYFYRATAVNAIGESPLSNTASAAASSLGTGSFATTSCAPATTCNSPQVSAIGTGGNATQGSISTEASAGPHTSTVSVGGPKLTGCTVAAPVALSLTFNDTSTDAYKTVTWILNGSDAQTWYTANNPTPAFGELCLGLGTPWLNGQGGPVTWTPTDGLYEGRVVACANNGLYSLGGGHYSQPCYNSVTSFTGPNVTKIVYTISLPPGDGKISGGS